MNHGIVWEVCYLVRLSNEIVDEEIEKEVWEVCYLVRLSNSDNAVYIPLSVWEVCYLVRLSNLNVWFWLYLLCLRSMLFSKVIKLDKEKKETLL